MGGGKREKEREMKPKKVICKFTPVAVITVQFITPSFGPLPILPSV